MTTDKTIKSKYQPKQTNVTWVDLSGKIPVEKHFINGEWRPLGGSGNGSGGSGDGCDCHDYEARIAALEEAQSWGGASN